MSLRFRRSMQLIPGVRLNFSKSALGLSVGVPGARVSVNTKGQVYSSVGLPGTGLYSVEQTSLRGTKSQRRNKQAQTAEVASAAQTPAPTPGLIATKRERAFHKFLLAAFDEENKWPDKKVIRQTQLLAREFPLLELPCLAIAAIHAMRNDESVTDGELWMTQLWEKRKELFENYIADKYFSRMYPQVQLTRGISSPYPFNLTALGLLYSEVLQETGKVKEAKEVVKSLTPTPFTAISLAELNIDLKLYDEVISATEDIEVESDTSGMLQIFRGIAFTLQGFHDAAVEVFKTVIAKRSLSEEVLNRALVERAKCYRAMGKKAMAIKDLEKILAREGDYPEIKELISEVGKT